MRWRQAGWGLFLAGLPLSPLLIGPLTGHKIDLWHSQAWWTHLWLILLVGMSLSSGTCQVVRNLPLACWTVWMGGWWAVSFLRSIMSSQGYDLAQMLGILHLATGLVAYLLATQVTREEWPTILRWVARTGVVLSVYGLLQAAGFEQFFTDIIHHAKNRRVLGTIGNPSHYAAYLSCVLPCVLGQSGRQWKVGAGLVLTAIVVSRSLGGMVAAALVLLVWWWCRNRKLFWWGLAGIGGLAGLQYAVDVWGLQHGHSTPVFSMSGRLLRWGLFLDLFRERLITGSGPGAILALSQTIPNDEKHPLYHWRHCHNEYLQLLIEQGVVGLAAVGWMLTDWWRKAWAVRYDRTALMLTLVGVAFLCNAVYNFPAHLWIMASLGLVAYGGIYGYWSERTA